MRADARFTRLHTDDLGAHDAANAERILDALDAGIVLGAFAVHDDPAYVPRRVARDMRDLEGESLGDPRNDS